MTTTQLIAALSAAFQYRLGPDTVTVYLDMLERHTSDPALRTQAAHDLIEHETRFPTVATILKAYRAARDRQPAPRAIEAPELTDEQRDYNARMARELMRRLNGQMKDVPAA